MKSLRLVVLGGLVFILAGCFSREEKQEDLVTASPQVVLKAPVVDKTSNKDKSLNALIRYFEQADAIHREAWWVLTSERRPIGKSPFGKIQRALLSAQNIKLTNKSMFRCDRYLVKRDVLGLEGFPQKAEIFEKCSEKMEAKRIADFFAPSNREVQLTFFPENLEEVLGLGATVLNKSIQCVLKGNEREQLVSLSCKDWAQDRTKEQMIRLDTYDYEKEGKNLIKLRGKVYENLSDTRKIVADIPMEGKVEVVETELYPPEAAPTPTPASPPIPKKAAAPKVDAEGTPDSVEAPPQITPLPGTPLMEGMAVPPPREQPVDPDVLMQQSQSQEPVLEGTLGTGHPLPEPQGQHPLQPESEGVQHGR